MNMLRGNSEQKSVCTQNQRKKGRGAIQLEGVRPSRSVSFRKGWMCAYICSVSITQIADTKYGISKTNERKALTAFINNTWQAALRQLKFPIILKAICNQDVWGLLFGIQTSK